MAARIVVKEIQLSRVDRVEAPVDPRRRRVSLIGLTGRVKASTLRLLVPCSRRLRGVEPSSRWHGATVQPTPPATGAAE